MGIFLFYSQCLFSWPFEMTKTSNLNLTWMAFTANALNTTVVCKKVHKIWPVWCKMALGEVGVSLSWWCHILALLAPCYWRLFLNLKSLVHNGKLTNFRGILSQSWNSEVSAILPYEFQSFNFDLKFLWNWSFFH